MVSGSGIYGTMRSRAVVMYAALVKRLVWAGVGVGGLLMLGHGPHAAAAVSAGMQTQWVHGTASTPGINRLQQDRCHTHPVCWSLVGWYANSIEPLVGT